ncbi:MAG: hypothetical protein AB7I19_02575 [Planctomycetota bacterium]
MKGVWFACVLALVSGCALSPPSEPAARPDSHSVDLLTVARHAISFTDPAAFRWRGGDTGSIELELFAPAQYAPPHRSPLAIALIPSPAVGDFRLRLQARQTSREYAHRDLCIVFGYRDPSHFAYVHLASAADPNAHGVFVVDGAARRKLPGTDHRGIEWGPVDRWHEIALDRIGDRLRVGFDQASPAIFDVDVRDVGVGAIGLGSFDDTGVFTAVELEAESLSNIDVTPFPSSSGRAHRPNS